MPATSGPEWSTPFRIDGTGGEAVVLIHGFTGHPGHWIPLSEELARKDYTVLAPLLTGHSSGVRELAASRWRDWVDVAFHAARSVSDHRQVHLVGLSLGGLIAILLARATAATSITTINAPVVLQETRAYLAPLARRVVPFVPAPEEEAPDPDLDHLWILQDRRSTAAVDQLLRVIWRTWWEAGRLRRPSLVIQSRVDQVVRPISGALLARRLRARLLRIDTHHNALLDPQRNVLHLAVIEHLAGATRNGPASRSH